MPAQENNVSFAFVIGIRNILLSSLNQNYPSSHQKIENFQTKLFFILANEIKF